MDEKTIQRIKKLQALAERGVGGEKTTAQKKLAKLLKDNGINSLDELQKEEYEYTIFSYNGKHEIKLLRQCMYKVMGAKSDRTAYQSNRIPPKSIQAVSISSPDKYWLRHATVHFHLSAVCKRPAEPPHILKPSR